MKELKPTTVAVLFIYNLATIFAISLGKDRLSLVNRFGSFDFISVYLVTMKRIGLQWL
jgi:hypothetical protein